MNYGLPYTGSKSRIAEWLIDQLPSCETFVDVFCGGCAVSHAMILHSKANKFILNDLQGDVPNLFVDALKGDLLRYDPLHWVSREQFFAEKATNPFIRLVYSFGQKGDTYLYSKDLEPYKRAIHYAIVEDEWSEFKRLCPEVCDDTNKALDGLSGWNERRLAFQRAVALSLRGLSRQNPYYKSPSTLDGVHAAQHLEQTQRLVEIQSPNLPSIQTESNDYRDLVIPEGAVVFCDPPYRASKVVYGGIKFDHNAFYDWAVEVAKTHPVFITEYQIDDPRFVCIGERARQISLNGTRSKGKKIERLYRVA